MAENTVVTGCTVSAGESMQPTCVEWIGIPLTEAVGKGASWLCRLSDCLSVLSLCLSWSWGESTVMPFCSLWWTSQWAKLYLGAVLTVGLWRQIKRRNWKIPFCVAIFFPVFTGVSGNVLKLLCKFSYNSCPSHSQLNGFLMGYWTANWSTLLWLREAVAASLP